MDLGDAKERQGRRFVGKRGKSLGGVGGFSRRDEEGDMVRGNGEEPTKLDCFLDFVRVSL